MSKQQTTYTQTIAGQTFETRSKGRVSIRILKGASITNLSTGKTYTAAFRGDHMAYLLPDGGYIWEARGIVYTAAAQNAIVR